MRGTRRAALALAAALATASGAGADPVPVEIAALDGLTLAGTFYGAARPGPGVLLLHQCNRDRHSFDELAIALADAGMHVLTFDFRGFGESRDAASRDWGEQSDELWPHFGSDVDRAVDLLASMPDVEAERLGVLGASCGGSQALLLALREPRIRAAGFLSSSLPRIDGIDLDDFASNADVAVLAIAAEADGRAWERTRALFDRSDHAESRLFGYKGALHGVPLFDHDPSLVDSVVTWFLTVL